MATHSMCQYNILVVVLRMLHCSKNSDSLIAVGKLVSWASVVSEIILKYRISQFIVQFLAFKKTLLKAVQT